MIAGSSDTGRVTGILRRHMPGQRFRDASLRFRQADFSFRELVTWKHRLTLGVPARTSEFVFSDADEVRNRLVVGVASETGRVVVMNLLQDMQVPTAAVEILVVERVNVAQSLTSSLRPTVGRLGISINNEGNPTCTLGYNVRVGTSTGEKYGLTNSHCTAAAGGEENTTFNQARAPSSVGTEYLDPTWWSTGCSANRVCRYSDAALFSYSAQTNAGAARLARPSGGPNGGSLFIDAANPEIPVTNESTEPVTGDSTSYPQSRSINFTRSGRPPVGPRATSTGHASMFLSP